VAVSFIGVGNRSTLSQVTDKVSSTPDNERGSNKFSYSVIHNNLLILQALVDIVNKIGQSIPSARTGKKMFYPTDVKTGSAINAGDGGLTKTSDEKPFDSMNNIVANLLLNMTR
jgi:hypothetical protein